MSGLHPEDKVTLETAPARSPMPLIFGKKTFNSANNVILLPLLKRLRAGGFSTTDDPELCEAHELVTRLDALGLGEEPTELDVEDVFPRHWLGDPEKEAKNAQICEAVGNWFGGELDFVQLGLGLMIMVFDPLGLELRDPVAVERVQLSLVTRLQRYLETKEGRTGAVRRTADTIRVLELAKEAQKISEGLF